MNEQAVQERRGRGLNIAEVAFYSVLVLLIFPRARAQTDASVTIRPLILIPVQWLGQI